MAILPNFADGQNEQNWVSAKILKRKKIKVFIIRITPQALGQGKVFPLSQTWNKSMKRFNI